MKREGRQHGMVQTFQIMPTPPLNTKVAARRRLINQFESPSTAGIFTKVPTKPTNHSKFTSRCLGRPGCNGCHDHPACKSKSKVKGTRKVSDKGFDDSVSDLRLVSWRVVDSNPWLRNTGFSATEYLDHLDDYRRSYVQDQDYYLDDQNHEIDESGDDLVDDNDENLDFCDVGLFVLEQVHEDDEGWCLVGEM